MDYEIGNIGRVVVARAYDGEEIYPGVEGIAAKESINNAVVLMVGGMRKGKVVVGPKNPDGPIEPTFREFDDAREILGVGTIFADEQGPKMHLHAGIGRGDEPMVGCPRGGASVFCVLEIIIIEINGIDAKRLADESPLKLLKLANPKSI